MLRAISGTAMAGASLGSSLLFVFIRRSHLSPSRRLSIIPLVLLPFVQPPPVAPLNLDGLASSGDDAEKQASRH